MTLAVDLFIVWFLLIIIFGHRSSPSLFALLLRPFAPLIDGLGLRQHWAMFAPDPTASSMRLHAIVQLKSGAALRWDPPDFRGSRVRAWLGFRRRLFELMLGTADAAAARRALSGYLVRTYAAATDPAVAVTFVATLRTSTPWMHDDGAPGSEEIIEVVPIDAVDAVDTDHR